ncbi:MAG: hypothetical protein CMB06_02185 [Euryarchaeota archaeon]|nr:hypothetical protein [Euryarchaeota archaeon]|tara:strand:- start:9 stop:605 length:597 start_codon:yes stop_codon:yes gene_type:complete
MEELWIFCEICDEECPHEVLKSRTSTKKGFSFQGVVKCIECNTTGPTEIKEVKPIELRLRISNDDETHKGFLHLDRGALIKVGETRPHPDGLIMITGLEIGSKRPNQAYSDDNPIVWAKRATHARVRFAIHDGESTISVKKEFEFDEEFRIGRKIRIEGEMAIIKDINLYGGKSVKIAHAIEISRVTCVYGRRSKRKY